MVSIFPIFVKWGRSWGIIHSVDCMWQRTSQSLKPTEFNFIDKCLIKIWVRCCMNEVQNVELHIRCCKECRALLICLQTSLLPSFLSIQVKWFPNLSMSRFSVWPIVHATKGTCNAIIQFARLTCDIPFAVVFSACCVAFNSTCYIQNSAVSAVVCFPQVGAFTQSGCCCLSFTGRAVMDFPSNQEIPQVFWSPIRYD